MAIKISIDEKLCVKTVQIIETNRIDQQFIVSLSLTPFHKTIQVLPLCTPIPLCKFKIPLWTDFETQL